MSCRSPEYASVIHCTSGLTCLLQHNISVSGKLLEKGLVSVEVHEWILTAQGVSSRERAGRLVSCVADSVQASSDKFKTLIEVLREDSYFDDIVRRMSDECGKINC